MEITDQMLSAYIDGELELFEVEIVEEQLARNKGLRDHVDRLNAVNSLLNQAFSIEKDVPEKLCKLVENSRVDLENVTAFRSKKEKSQKKSSNFYIPTAIAASITLVLGVMFGYWTQSTPEKNELDAILVSNIDGHSELYDVLENSPSSTSVKLIGRDNQEIMIEPLLSFKSVNGDYCREFDIHDSNKALAGIACREADATWRLEIIVASDTQPSADGKYQLSSGQDKEALDYVARNLMSNGPLSKTEEADLIARQWK